MGRVATVAYEKPARRRGKVAEVPPEPPAALESGLADYVAQTKKALAVLGSPDPSADVAAQKDYIARARGVGLSPAVAANTIYALRHGFSPMMLQEPAAQEATARDYIAVDMNGRKVWGPSKDYIETKKHAEMAGGFVKFEPGVHEAASAGEGAADPRAFWKWESSVYQLVDQASRRGELSASARPPNTEQLKAMWREGLTPAEAAQRIVSGAIVQEGAADFDTRAEFVAKLHADNWTHMIGSLSNGYVFRQRSDGKWEEAEVFSKGSKFHIGKPYTQRHRGGIGFDDVELPTHAQAVPAREDAQPVEDAKLESCVHHVKQDSPDANPWAVCHAALGREPEPFTKTVHWHRGDNGGYYTDAPTYGRIWVRNRSSDKKNGKLAWYAVVKRVEVVQGETRSEVSSAVEAHLKSPGAAAGECVRVRSQGDVDVIERDPACAPEGVMVDTARQVHASMKDRIVRLGHEEFYVIGVSKQGERVGQPVVIAMGQVDRVNVDIVAVVSAAANLRTSGAVAVWCAHNHPSNHGYEPSPQDRDLTKKIRKAMDAIEMEFKGHLVLSEKHVSRA